MSSSPTMHDNLAATIDFSDVSTDTYCQTNTRRTVMISGLPGSMSLLTVLTKIRGGEIEESELLGPFSLEGINVARVVFVDEPSAQTFVETAPVHPSMFYGMDATIDLVSTTGPVEDHHGHTRCLELRNILVPIKEEELLKAIGDDESYHPISMIKHHHIHIILQFSSIEKAEHAAEVLQGAYYGCQPHFIEDPCAEPLELFEALLPPRVFAPI